MKKYNKTGYFTKTEKNEEKFEKHIKKKTSEEARDKKRKEARELKKQHQLEQSQIKSNSNSQQENTVFILINIKLN